MCKGSQEKFSSCFGPEELISLKLQFHDLKSSPKCVQIHTLISCGAVFKRDFCVCSLVILPCLPKQTGRQSRQANRQQLACWACTTLCAKGVIDSPHMVVLYRGAAAAAATPPTTAVVARRVFDRGVFVRFPVGFCHRIQLRAIALLAWSDY